MLQRFTKIQFTRFKAFKNFQLNLKTFKILVGPNNAGKSTILAAFRILAAAMRKAERRNAVPIRGPRGRTQGHSIDLRPISVAEENIYFNYDDQEPASITFYIDNGNSLTLYFPDIGSCFLLTDPNGQAVVTTSSFKKQFNCPIGFVPILGPVDHNEPLYEQEAARLALFNFGAARNFRNIWHHYPESFERFRSLLTETWPGMDIQKPIVDRSHTRPLLHMFCPEDRIPRELFWSGFGFQVWCQMLTHVIQSRQKSIFLIDEPDIYLHSDLQRQLLGILRDLGPDILLATHSTEIISEAEPDEIVLVDKRRPSARRIKDPSDLGRVFEALGSNANPILTQLAKTRRALFVEGKDFQVLSRFARKLGAPAVANRRDFAVIPIDGFNPGKIKILKEGMELTLGSKISVAAILDRDYRCDEERKVLEFECRDFCDLVSVHERKEIENYTLVAPAALRATLRRMGKSQSAGGTNINLDDIEKILDNFCETSRTFVISRMLAEYRRFTRAKYGSLNDTTINETMLNEFERLWKDKPRRLALVSGKDALTALNTQLQQRCKVSTTTAAIVEAMKPEEVAQDLRLLIASLDDFTRVVPRP
jgi:energy-coupling factor transporter ATP-binding protein EcfA2